MSAAALYVAIIGCGNPTRSDDGVGPAVIATLAAGRLGGSEAVRLYDAGTDGMAVLFAARGCDTLILVDACRSGAEPGAVFEIPATEIETPHTPALSTHELRWEHALVAGRRILGDEFPADATVFLIEAETLDFGIGLSLPVGAAAARVAARIEEMAGAVLTARAAEI